MDRPVVFHIPHSSAVVPDEDRLGILLADDELEAELVRMTDWYTDVLFESAAEGCSTIRFPVSRLVLDPERFEDDAAELMASRGMGVIYTMTSGGHPLRDPLEPSKREAALEKYYRPHHARLTEAVARKVEVHGRALIIDCHSFPAKPLPYEIHQSPDRPEICIGTDEYHTPAELTKRARLAFENQAFTVDIDTPFAGALVPSKYWQTAPPVSSIMIEIRRDLYMDEATGQRAPGFDALTRRVTAAVTDFIEYWNPAAQPIVQPDAPSRRG